MSAEYGLCLTCYEVIDPLVYQRSDTYNICPKMGCNYEMIWVDELMLPIIISLNKKGYRTRQCCSSHLWDPDLYIEFDPGIIIPRKLPEGIYLDSSVLMEEFEGKESPNMADQKIKNTIRTEWTTREDWDSLSVIERQRLIFTYVIRLLEWAEALPEINERSNVRED